jgi:hypothetical protein
MDAAVQAVADRTEAALALIYDPALRAAARRRAGASKVRRLVSKAIQGIQTACRELPQGLMLRPAVVASLLAMLEDESTATLPMDLAITACSCFIETPSCLQQVRLRPWWCCCKGGG